MLPVTQHVLGYSGDCLTIIERTHFLCTKDSLHYSVFLAFLPQRVERGEASGNGPEGAPSPILCVLCSVPPHSPEPGGNRGLWLSGTSVETWCQRCEWPAAAGVWGSQQFHQHSLFWLWRYCVFNVVSLHVCVNPIMNWQPARGVHLSPSACWDRPTANLYPPQDKNDFKWMFLCLWRLLK